MTDPYPELFPELNRKRYKARPTEEVDAAIDKFTKEGQISNFSESTIIGNVRGALDSMEGNASPLDYLRDLSAANKIEEMEADMSIDTFIFDELALNGQITLFYAKPNAGKTLFFLRFLIDSIKEERIKASDVFYINADDNYKGLLTKARIAKKYGFEMISPQQAGLQPKAIVNILDGLSKTDEATGKIIVLDTLKKFAGMMSKDSQSSLYNVLRQLNAKNATVIIAGHANKHAGPDGKLIFEGVGDVMSDIDAAYSINIISSSDGENVVKFINEKDRGNNIPEVSYEYLKKQGMNYYDILASITRLNDSDSKRSDDKLAVELIKEKYESERLFVMDLLKTRDFTQAGILEAFRSGDHQITAEFSRNSLRDSLKALINTDWIVNRGEKNSLIYSLKSSYSNVKGSF